MLSRYIEFTLRKYGKTATIILIEIESVPSITDEKASRNKKGICGSEISFSGATHLNVKKQEFLNNVNNRNNFIRCLSTKLAKAGCTVIRTYGDENIEISSTAARMSREKDVVVVGEEGSLVVLLCYYAETEHHGIYLRGYRKTKISKSRLWNITETKRSLGISTSKHLLFANAFGGCQSVSHIFGVGEGILFSKLNEKHFSGKRMFLYITSI